MHFAQMIDTLSRCVPAVALSLIMGRSVQAQETQPGGATAITIYSTAAPGAISPELYRPTTENAGMLVQIIGMGPAVVPLILEELQREPDHWFWALEAITQQDPVPPEARGDVGAMADAWIAWGKQQGYLPA